MKAMAWTCGLAMAATLIWIALEERAGRQAAEASAAADRAQLQALAESVQGVQRELRATRVQRASAPHPRPAAGLAEPADVHAEQEAALEEPVAAEPTAELTVAEQTEQFVDHADQVLAVEARDSSWREASELPVKLKTILPAGSLLEAVTCGSTLCRVESKHRNLDAYNAFVAELASRPKPGVPPPSTPFWGGSSAAYLVLGDQENLDPASEVHAIAYLARENAILPSL